MNFLSYQEKIQEWAKQKGIYELSDEAHQQAKALEEIGEILTAKTAAEEMLEIGDVMVTIINCYYFRRGNFAVLSLGDSVEMTLSRVASNILRQDYNRAAAALYNYTEEKGYDFIECLEGAYNKIQNRTGVMVDGMFVKQETNDE